MPDYITYRETIEYTVEVSTRENDIAHYHDDEPDYLRAENVKSVLKEAISRRHEPDYVVDMDEQREVWILRADKQEVFAHRSHDAVMARFTELTGTIVDGHDLFGDLDDPSKGWRVLAEGRTL